jgi:hypothetical protein
MMILPTTTLNEGKSKIAKNTIKEQSSDEDMFQVRNFALTLVKNNDHVSKIKDISSWVQSNIVYVSDPSGRDYVASPQETLNARHGDCEDYSVLISSLLEDVGEDAIVVLMSSPDSAHAEAFVRVDDEKMARSLMGNQNKIYGLSYDTKLYVPIEQNEIGYIMPEYIQEDAGGWNFKKSNIIDVGSTSRSNENNTFTKNIIIKANPTTTTIPIKPYVTGIFLDVEKPDGTVVQTSISKNANGKVDDLEIMGVYAEEADAVATASILVKDTTTGALASKSMHKITQENGRSVSITMQIHINDEHSDPVRNLFGLNTPSMYGIVWADNGMGSWEDWGIFDIKGDTMYLAKYKILDDISSEGYTSEYMGYKFKIDHLVYN